MAIPSRESLVNALGDLCRATLEVQCAYDIPPTIGGQTRNKTRLILASRHQKYCLQELLSLLNQPKLTKQELDIVQSAYVQELTR